MQEIERRFWIETLPSGREDFPKTEIIQWYCIDPTDKSKIRIRKSTTNKKTIYTKTIKHGKWLVREEIESKISVQERKNLRPLAENISLSKSRYLIPHKKHTIELNIFHNNLDGIRLAEVEFDSIQASKKFSAPARFGPEVTESKYSTSHYLAKNGKSDLITSVKPYDQIIREDLASFYDAEASKYASTRKKTRPEAELLLSQILSHPEKHLKILEVGCGSGRFLELLNQLSDKSIEYTGIDISQWLLDEAKKIELWKHIKATFIKSDMLSYLKNQTQESHDMIVGIASVQHLTDKKSRLLFSKLSYRNLKYWGIILLSNRSFSTRFLQKYRRSFLETAKSIVLKKDIQERNSFMLPRKSQNKIFKRFYHIFTKDELRYIIEKAGFTINTLGYLNKQGLLSENRKDAKNTLIVAKKIIFVK